MNGEMHVRLDQKQGKNQSIGQVTNLWHEAGKWAAVVSGKKMMAFVLFFLLLCHDHQEKSADRCGQRHGDYDVHAVVGEDQQDVRSIDHHPVPAADAAL